MQERLDEINNELARLLKEGRNNEELVSERKEILKTIKKLTND